MMKRVEILDNLSSAIEPQHLLVEYGGNLKVTLDDLYQKLVLKSDELEA